VGRGIWVVQTGVACTSSTARVGRGVSEVSDCQRLSAIASDCQRWLAAMVPGSTLAADEALSALGALPAPSQASPKPNIIWLIIPTGLGKSGSLARSGTVWVISAFQFWRTVMSAMKFSVDVRQPVTA